MEGGGLELVLIGDQGRGLLLGFGLFVYRFMFWLIVYFMVRFKFIANFSIYSSSFTIKISLCNAFIRLLVLFIFIFH